MTRFAPRQFSRKRNKLRADVRHDIRAKSGGLLRREDRREDRYSSVILEYRRQVYRGHHSTDLVNKFAWRVLVIDDGSECYPRFSPLFGVDRIKRDPHLGHEV